MSRKLVAWHVEYDRSGKVVRTLYRQPDSQAYGSVCESAQVASPSKPDPAPKVSRGVQQELL